MRDLSTPSSMLGTAFAVLVAGSFGLASQAAQAAGFQDRAGNPDWTANAFAGMAAKGYDASTAWSNPAAMTLLPGNAVDIGLNYIHPISSFSGVNTVAGVPLLGTTGGNAGQDVFVPSGAGVWSLSPALKLGLSLEAPFGQREAYPGNFVGRYQALVSALTDVQIGLAVAYRINDNISIGGGPIIDYLHARLTSAINTGPSAFLTGDPVADVHGDSWNAGYHLGALIEFDKSTRVGIDYRSRITERIEGSQEIFVPPLLAALSPASARLLAAGNTAINTSVTLPDVLTVSGVWDINAEWSALATAQWTNWAVLPQVNIIGANGQITSLALGLHSTWLGSVGANYRPGWAPGLMLQSGLGYDESPSSNSNRTPRLPGRDAILLGVGASYPLQENLIVKAAYLHEFGVGSRSIGYSAAPSAGVLSGNYETGADVVSVGISWQF